ncbi:hypothetical protein T11_6825 [Trichinella zimbabwensis]|uniref:Uncharacterized protein n=1 Tax=Trichinella zimbabwensis TaxID=268475 RepID=A0A0V1HAV3_9BILA|nr:hypothetical protein T11_6825 [Trichinella zimbabwensis]
MKNKFGNIDNFLIEYQYGYQYRIKTHEVYWMSISANIYFINKKGNSVLSSSHERNERSMQISVIKKLFSAFYANQRYQKIILLF